jgi:hypothetical protein
LITSKLSEHFPAYVSFNLIKSKTNDLYIYDSVFAASIGYLTCFSDYFILLGVCDVREGCASAPVFQATRLAGKTHRILQVANRSMTNLPTPLKNIPVPSRDVSYQTLPGREL